MNQKELEKILKDHQDWLQDDGGKRANLRWANLTKANLTKANLTKADLSWADLSGANLSGANLSGADLSGADLREANLSAADLYKADLSGAYLIGAKIIFTYWPSITLLSSMPLGDLSDELTLELMRRDAYAHPYPEKFDEWALGENCPYQNEETFWQFTVKRELWHRGNPQMADRDLILAICKEKGWGIRGHLEIRE